MRLGDVESNERWILLLHFMSDAPPAAQTCGQYDARIEGRTVIGKGEAEMFICRTVSAMLLLFIAPLRLRDVRRTAALTTVAAALLTGATLWPDRSVADGALAVGLPANVAQEGFAYGIALNTSANEAGAMALSACRRKSKQADKRAQALCAVTNTFSNQCFAVALDPRDSTPGVGWAIEANKKAAERVALTKCRVTAGEGRQQFCTVDRSGCDGSAK